MARVAFTFEQLRTFLAVARQQSISRAAESLFLTQGAVSQQVANLETALGLRLLERRGRRVWLTEAGKSIAIACEAVTRSVEGVTESARQLAFLEAGSLHIGASPTPAAHYLPRLLSAFTSLHPGVQIRVVTENTSAVTAQVASGALDCAIVEGGIADPDLVEHRLAEDEVLVVAARDHPLAVLARVDLEELVKHRFLGREPGAAMETIAKEILGDRYASMQRIELGHLDAVRGSAVAGLGFAILPKVAVRREMRDGDLVALSIPPRRRWIRVIRRPSPGGAALEEFWHLLRPKSPPPFSAP